MNRCFKQTVSLTWAQRAQAELGAAERFINIAEEVARHTSHHFIMPLIARAIEDEMRHSRLCSAVARSHGHDTGFARANELPKPLEKTWLHLAARDRLLCEITLMCALTETFNASLLNSIEAALDSRSQSGRIISNILFDEVKHSQIGWAFLFAESRIRDISFLEEYIPNMLDIAVKDELFLPATEPFQDDDSIQHGVLPESLRLKQFSATLLQLILPGLEKYGIQTAICHIWLQNKLQLMTTNHPSPASQPK